MTGISEMGQAHYDQRPPGRVVLEVRNAVKRFGNVIALDDVSLALHSGEILALLGDNGAGKSTLVKCLSGVHRLDEGGIFIEDQQVDFRNPSDAHAKGIDTVYQDLALFDNLDASANFFVGRELSRPKWFGPLGFLRDRAMEEETRGIIERLQVTVRDPKGLIGLMSGGQRQAVACARAVAFAKRIAILDEPTAALGLRESTNVLDLVKRLPEHGVSVILISHNLEQVMRVADRAVVLRRGEKVGEAVPTPENHQLLVSLIVGGMAR